MRIRRSATDDGSLAPDRGDGLTAISYFHACIVNADTKSGFLVAGLAVLAATEFKQVNRLLWHHGDGGWIVLLSASALVLSLCGTVYGAFSLMCVLVPRTAPPGDFSRYSFPVVARQRHDFMPELNADSQRVEAWIQAVALARIAERKFHFFRHALYSVGISALFLGLASVGIR